MIVLAVRGRGLLAQLVLAWNCAVIPGWREAANPEPMNTTLFQLVMLALVASIHVLASPLHEGRRGWSGQARP
jgi:hypothetical protein